jgi:hypothetical protein
VPSSPAPGPATPSRPIARVASAWPATSPGSGPPARGSWRPRPTSTAESEAGSRCCCCAGRGIPGPGSPGSRPDRIPIPCSHSRSSAWTVRRSRPRAGSTCGSSAIRRSTRLAAGRTASRRSAAPPTATWASCSVP